MIKNRIISMILLLIVVMVMTGAAALAFENEPEGFRGLNWGDPPTEEMEFFRLDSLLKYYTIPNENLYLGNVTLYSVLYQFFIRANEEVFSGAVLCFRGKENYDRMSRICLGKFGEETKNRFRSTTWFSLKSNVILYYDPIEKLGFLSMISSPILLEHGDTERKLEAEKAQGDW